MGWFCLCFPKGSLGFPLCWKVRTGGELRAWVLHGGVAGRVLVQKLLKGGETRWKQAAFLKKGVSEAHLRCPAGWAAPTSACFAETWAEFWGEPW